MKGSGVPKSWLIPLVAVSAGLAVWTFEAAADPYSEPEGVPRLLPFHGQLEHDGSAVAHEVTIEASLYDAAAGGRLLWGPETHVVTPANGAFTLLLGSTETLGADVMAGGDAWVALAVNGAQLDGRQRLGAAPYALRAADGVPAGTVNAYAGTTAPNGWILADGRALDADDPRYAALFAALGTVYGDGSSGAGASGSTDFNVPDLRGRTVIGSGTYADPVAGTTERTLGERLGAAEHVLTVAQMPSHTHGYGDYHYYDEQKGSKDHQTPEGDETGIRLDTPRDTDPAGGNAPHNNMQPSLVLHYIVKL